MEIIMVLNEIIPLAASSSNRALKVELPDQDLLQLGLDSLDKLIILTFVLDLYEIEDEMHDVPNFNTPAEIEKFVHGISAIRFENHAALLSALSRGSGKSPKSII